MWRRVGAGAISLVGASEVSSSLRFLLLAAVRGAAARPGATSDSGVSGGRDGGGAYLMLGPGAGA